MTEDVQNNDFTNDNTEKNITIKKSTYNNILKGIVVAIAFATFLGGYALGTFGNSDSLSKDEIKEMILEINTNTPMPLQPVQAPTSPPTPSTIQVSTDDDPMIGNPNAPITIVEFSDFQCPFCARFYHDTLSQIEQNYIQTGKANLVFRDMPLESIHPNAFTAHVAAECANKQDKFWQYHDMLFERQFEWQSLSLVDAKSKFIQYSQDLGIGKTFESCLSDKSISDEVRNDLSDAQQYRASGTPTFFIGNEKNGFTTLVGAQPYQAFQSVIENLSK